MKFKDYDWPSNYDSPLSHQVKTVIFLLKHKFAYVLNSMGTGKTLSCLWACDFLGRNKKINKVLVVAPLSTLQSVWANEVFTHIRTRKAVILHHYNKQKRIEKLDEDAMFYIINHDGIKIMEEHLIKKNFDVIIIDELTAFKNNQSDRTKCMQRIAHGVRNKGGAKAVWGLTGSMTANNPLDAYGQMKTVNPYNPMVQKYYTQFRNLLTTQFDEFTYIPRDNWRDLLFPMVQPAIRFTLEECNDLPEMIVERRDVEMTAAQKKVYRTMKKEFIVELKEGKIKAANAGVKVMKLMQISCGAVFNTDGEIVEIENSNKLKELQSIYDELDTKKIIVFSTFRASLHQIRDYFHKKGVSAEIVYGGVPAKKRAKIFNDFQKGSLQALVMQPVASAHGLTLTASNTIVWFGPVVSNEIDQQANHRIRRPGQTNKQLVIRLQSSEIERKVYKALEGKELMSSQLLEMIEND